MLYVLPINEYGPYHMIPKREIYDTENAFTESAFLLGFLMTIIAIRENELAYGEWFPLPVQEVLDQIGLSRRLQAKAMIALERDGFVKQKLTGKPPQRMIKVLKKAADCCHVTFR